MATVYILYSLELNKFYIGSCIDLQMRLHQHINKDFGNSFTSKVADWVVFLAIDNLNYEQSRCIEQHIKKMKSVTYIKNLKIYPEIVGKLIERYK